MRIVLTGAAGQLGSHLIRALAAGNRDIRAWTGSRTGARDGVPLEIVPLDDLARLERALDDADPAAILHAGAVSRADRVHAEPALGELVNVRATALIADWAARRSRKLIYTSTDLVFDGLAPMRRETDPARPVLAYGRTKFEGEAPVLAAPGAIVARLALMYGPSLSDVPTYFDQLLEAGRAGRTVTQFDDEFRSPLHYADAAAILVALLESDVSGLLHVAGPERLSRRELVRQAFAANRLDPELVRGNKQADVAFPEPRPADVSLDIAKLRALLPDLPPRPVAEASRT